jgi:hypothetical protein
MVAALRASYFTHMRNLFRALVVAFLLGAATIAASGTAFAKPHDVCRFLSQVYKIQSRNYDSAHQAGNVDQMIHWRNLMWDTRGDMQGVGC